MSSLTYKDSGVDITKGNKLIEKIKPIAKSTLRPGVLDGLGGFGAMFEIPIDKYKNPVLVSGTDGVGTKLMVAEMLNKHDTIGIDLVAMCVNDLIVQGSEPLFFLDYYATGSLNTEIATSVISGIGEGCIRSGCSLIGGETAEMPGMYKGEEYDLAGFCVGIVEKDNIIDDLIYNSLVDISSVFMARMTSERRLLDCSVPNAAMVRTPRHICGSALAFWLALSIL